jgi:hypothetical protein
MERIMLWSLLILGIALFLFSLQKPPIKTKLIIFLLTAYISTFFGVLVVEKNMLKYPINLFSNYFSSSLLYEYLLLPMVCIYFYQTSYHSSYFGMVLQCAMYTAALTIIEVVLERYTDLVEYHTWTWLYTLLSIFLLMMVIRILIQFIDMKDNRKSG